MIRAGWRAVVGACLSRPVRCWSSRRCIPASTSAGTSTRWLCADVHRHRSAAFSASSPMPAYPRLMTENRRNARPSRCWAASPGSTTSCAGGDAARRPDGGGGRGRGENTAIGGSVWRQLSGRYPAAPPRRRLPMSNSRSPTSPAGLEATWLRLRVLLEEKAAVMARLRRDISFKAIMDFMAVLPCAADLHAAGGADRAHRRGFLPVAPPRS